MRRSIKLSAFQEKVEKTFSDARSFSRGSLAMSDAEFSDLKIGIAETLLKLDHHRPNFSMYV